MKHTRKILVALLVVMTMLITLAAAIVPASAATPETLYLQPNSNWAQANARFAAYFFGNGEKWVSMTDSDGDGIYEVEVPSGYPSVIFCRMNPGATENNWDNKWNQTADLTIPIDGNNCYSYTDGVYWDKGSGSWSTYSGPVFTVAGEAGLCGTEWDASNTANDMTKNASEKYEKRYTGVSSGTYQYKIVSYHAWTYSWSNGSGSDGNSKIEVSDDNSTVIVTFDLDTKTVSATAHVCADVNTDTDHNCDVCGAAVGDHFYNNGVCDCGNEDTNLSGTGTESDPFVIYTVTQLKSFRNMVNGGTTFDNLYVQLNANLDLNNEPWTPIGNGTNKFLGTFNGQNYTVSNLNVNITDNNAGLFGFASVIKNVKINNAKVNGIISVGALVGELESSVGTVDNCHVTGNIQITGENSVGGLAGKGYANIKNSSVVGDGTDTSFVKGVYGTTEEGDNVGGLIGHLGEGNTLGVVNSTVKNIKVMGTRKVGGLVGTTARGNDYIGNTVDNVVVECTATEDYANENANTTTIGGIIGNYFGSATSGGILQDSTVSNVTFIVGNAKSAGVLAGGDRNNGGGAPVGVEASGSVVNNVTGATNEYLLPVPQGTITLGYIDANYYNSGVPAIYGEATHNANDSFVVKLYDASGNLVATTTLNDSESDITTGTERNITWHAALSDDGDSWWKTVWENNQPNVNSMPVKVVLYVDDVEVAENDIVLNKPDNYGFIVAAATDSTGKISAFYSADGWAGANNTVALQSALNAGGNIVLLRDVVLTEAVTIPAGVEVTLDLNGKTISQVKEQTAAYSMIVNNGTLTIVDSSLAKSTGGVISYTDSGNGGEYVSNTIINNGKLTVKGGTIINESSATVANNGYPHAIDNNGELIIEGGNVTGSYYSAIRIWCTTDDNTSVTIKDGVITGAIDLHNVNGNANKGALTIEGGTFKQANGTLNGATKSVRLLAFGTDIDDLAIDISGGSFEGDIVLSNYTGSTLDFSEVAEISGGTFANPVDESICAEGYIPTLNSDGTYGVKAGSYVAEINGVKYESLQAAVAAINGVGYGSIKLLADVTVDETINFNTLYYNTDGSLKGMIVFFDLNGYTLKSSASVAMNIEYWTATICDNSATGTGKFICTADNGILLKSNFLTNISSGYYEGKIAINHADGLPSGLDGITGGTFSTDVGNYCANGYDALVDVDGTYIVDKKVTSTVVNHGTMNIPASDIVNFNEDMYLSFVMEFIADQTQAEIVNGPYADWYADFVLTFNGIENDKFIADGCYLAGFYGNTSAWDGGWVRIAVDGMEIENGVNYPVMLGFGAGQKYSYIGEIHSFCCAMYIPAEIFDANPNLTVTLSLNLVGNKLGSDKATNQLMNGTYFNLIASDTYDIHDFVKTAQIGDKTYGTLEKAFEEAQEGDVIKLLRNVELSAPITVNKAVTYDFGEYTVALADGSGNAPIVAAKGFTILPLTDTRFSVIGVPHIVEDGGVKYWYVGNLSTGVEAQGPQGEPGKDGNGIANITVNEYKNSNGDVIGKEIVISYTDASKDDVSFIILDGVDGTNGTNGKKVEFKHENGVISYRYEGESAWTELGNFKGETGSTGPQGPQGGQGAAGANGVGIKEINVEDWIVNGALVGMKITFTLDDANETKKVFEVHSVITPVFQINSDGILQVSYDNKTTWLNLGKVVGEKGDKGDIGATGATGSQGATGATGAAGKDGVGVERIEINDTGELVIYYTNNTHRNLGRVVGYKGDKGDKGETGATGPQGPQGPAGADGEDGADGSDGTSGTNGVDGKTPIFRLDEETGDLYVSYVGEEGETKLGNIMGPQGEQGEQGEDGKDGESSEGDGKTSNVAVIVIAIVAAAAVVVATIALVCVNKYSYKPWWMI